MTGDSVISDGKAGSIPAHSATCYTDTSLRISVEELREWPLGHYLWAAVLQAAYSDG
jgi:hypothetical protein